jgi:thiosulfate dehydrogenase
MNTSFTSPPKKHPFNKFPLFTLSTLTAIVSIILFMQAFISGCSSGNQQHKQYLYDSAAVAQLFAPDHLYTAPLMADIPNNQEGNLIKYGLTIFTHTAKYFGPSGRISTSHNGLICQNCHLDAGTRPFGNNLGVVSTTYPRYLPRAGTILNTAEKINECFLRSLNGKSIDTASNEMHALVAYINWLGKDVKKGEEFDGSGPIMPPLFIDRAANPNNGKEVYDRNCARCHGKDGQGQLVTDVMKDESKQQGGTATIDEVYYYPPVWGDKSYNGVATLYRLSKLAGFVKYNMPYPVTYVNPVLTDEQAWDVAAYINSQPRPLNDHSKDYAVDISKKPFDFPFAPYADKFSEQQHKFGPYLQMPSAQHLH